MLGAGSVAALLAGTVHAGADTIVNYNFSPVNWVASNGTAFPADGGTLSGTMTYDGTNNTVVASNITSTASTAAGWTARNFTNMTYAAATNDEGPWYTYNGITYTTGTQITDVIEVTGNRTLNLVFTETDTTNIYPGLLNAFYNVGQ